MPDHRLSLVALPLAVLLFGALVFAAGNDGISALTAADATAHPGRLVRLPDGRRLNFRCAGSGQPTVLFEGGFAATSLAWYKVQPQVARTHRTCSYDRAGYGFSDPGPSPRDGAAVVKDLDDGLRAAHISGPFLLVGHSAGALYMRLFSDRRPREVVGMVLVDPSIEHQDARFAAAFGERAGNLEPQRSRAAACLDAARAGALPSKDPALARCTPPPPQANQPPAVAAARMAEAVRPSTWATQLSELDSLWGSTSVEVAAGRTSYGAMPLVVLTADGTYPGASGGAAELWRSLHQEIARRSTRGVERLVTRSSHLMMLDQPQAIIDAIDQVSAEAHNHGIAAN